MSVDPDQIRLHLSAIPDLAVEVEQTRDHPNPAGGNKGGRRPAGSRPPTDVAMLHAVLPDGDRLYAGKGLRGQLGMCVRLVREEMQDTMSVLDMPDYPSDTWAGITGWLTETLDWWIATPWADDVAADVKQVHATLRVLARARDEPAYDCPKCGDVMRLQSGGKWLRCDSGHEEEADLEARYRRRPPMPGSLCAAELKISEDTIATWRKRRLLQSVRKEGGKHWYLIWDVLLLAHPSVADAVTRRESA